MPSKKTADLSADLVAVKGQASTAADATGRQPEAPPAAPAAAPLNFKVDPDFRRRFRQRAAEADLKLNELLREALDAWEERRGLK
jgi:predicted HicB family RNase H-like nuclease